MYHPKRVSERLWESSDDFPLAESFDEFTERDCQRIEDRQSGSR